MSSSIAVSHPGNAEDATVRSAARFSLFDWIVTLLSAWFLGGLYLDGWAHHHLNASLETFFTPWHGVFYSGFLAVSAAIGVAALRNRLRGIPWSQATPAGYFGSLWITAGIWWSVHLWTGVIIMAGMVGLLVSYLVVPPAQVVQTGSV